MIILVPSIHHTGTKLVFNDILKGMVEINQQDPDPPEAGKIRIHIDEPFLDDIKSWLPETQTIVPMRHPRETALSWKKQFKSLTWLGEQIGWLKMIVDPFDPYYLRIDKKYRNRDLLGINLNLNTDFETEWPVIGHSEAPMQELDAHEESLVQSWMNDGFFDRFGYT